MARGARIGNEVRDVLWRVRTDEALELTRTLIESLSTEAPKLAPFYASAAEMARGAASRLLAFARKIGRTSWTTTVRGEAGSASPQPRPSAS